MASAIFQPCWYWRNRGSPAHAGIDPNITAQIQTAPGFPPSRPRPGARPAPSATGSTKSRPGRELPRKGSRPPVKPASSDDNPAHGPRSLVPARNRGRSGRSLRRRTQGGDPEEGECLEMPGYRRCERQPRGLATPDRRIIVLYGMIVSVIRFKNPLLHRQSSLRKRRLGENRGFRPSF